MSASRSAPPGFGATVYPASAPAVGDRGPETYTFFFAVAQFLPMELSG